MITKEELIKRYPDEVLEPFDDEEDKYLNLFFGTDVEFGNKYYGLFFVEKFFDDNDTYYNEDENIPEFINAFNEFGSRFIKFDTNVLKKEILKYISFKLKNEDTFLAIKNKVIADALVKNNLDDEDNKDYRLSELDMFDVIVSDDDLFKIVQDSFVFDQDEYNKTETRADLIVAYNKIKYFIKDEIEDAKKENDISRIKALESYQKYFDELLLSRINNAKDVVLSNSYPSSRAYFVKEDIKVSDFVSDDIREDFDTKINANIHISLDDVYNSIQDYHKGERFFDVLAYEEDIEDFYSNEFVNNFVNVCLSICKKEDGSSYNIKEILNYLSIKLNEFQKFQDEEEDSFMYDDYDSYEGEYYNGYEDEHYNGYEEYIDGVSKDGRPVRIRAKF